MATLALGACTPNAGGSGMGSGAKPGAESSDTGPDDPTVGPESAGTTTASTSPGDESNDGLPMDEGPSGHPLITISDGPMFDFGTHDLYEEVDQAFTITNEGDGDATALQVEELSGAFSIVTHDCSDVLAPQATCEVQVGFVAAQFGTVQAELQIGFQDQDMATMASLPIVGRGVGVTRNLVYNGGGEDGAAMAIPPMDWSIGYGPTWMAIETDMPYADARVISAGWGPPEPMPNTFTLDQQVDIAALTTWDDGAGLQIRYQAFHRSEAMGDDPTWIELRFLDSGAQEMGLHPGSYHSGTDWYMSVGNVQAPPGAHYVRISLQCDRMIGDACSGFFDGVELFAEWAG